MGVSYRGGKSVSRPSPRRRTPKGGVSYRGGKPISVDRGISRGAPSVYETLTPYGQSVSRAVRGMTGRVRGGAIATYEKAYRAPGTLTIEERAMIKPHLTEFSTEFQREFARAEMEVKLVKKKEEIRSERPDIRMVRPVPGIPGVSMGLLYGVTPDTKQLAAKTWKRISGVSPISIAKMGVAISPVGITTAPFMAMGKKLFPGVQKEIKEVIGWKPKAEREYERVHIETVGEMAKWERTPEGIPITPYELTPEAKGFKRRQEEVVREATERGWKTPEGIIEYPAIEGKEWALEYKQIQEIGKEYITPEGFYREEYYVPTKEAAKTLKQVEWLEKRGEEMASPTFMAKERTEGMWVAPAVTKAAEFGEWWEKEVSIPFEKATKKHPRVVTGLGMAPMPIVTVPRYVAKKGIEYFAPEAYKPYIEKMPLGVTDYPVSFKVGVVKGVPDIPIMAAEMGYGAEWIGRHPKEAAMIAPGVAAYIGAGMVKEAVTHPVEFAGRMATMAAITGGMGRVVRPVMPKYISGVKVTDTGVVTYKGIGLRGFKEPYPLIGGWKEIIGKAPKTKEMTSAQYARYLEKEGTLGGVFTWRMPKEVRATMREEGLGGYVSHFPPKEIERIYREYEAKGWTRAEVQREMRPFKFTKAEHEIFISPMHYLGRLQVISPIVRGLRYGTGPVEMISRAREVGYGRPRRQVLAHELFHIKYPKLAEEAIIELERTLGTTKRPFHVELVKGTPEYSVHRALVLGKDYPLFRRLKAVKDVEFAMPEFGVGARVFGKQLYTEIGIGRAMKRERMRMEGLFGKDYLLAAEIAEVPKDISMPKIAALPPPKPVLWERVGPTAIAERITALMKTKPIKEWGLRIEKPIIPTYEELAVGRGYRITMGYDAFQIGRYPKYLKVLGLDKGVPTFAKGIEKIIHPFREKVPAAYEPSILDYRMPKGLLTEGLILDISRAKIRPTERPPSPIEKIYERITPEDVYRDFGVERRPTIISKEVLKPIETRYLKFDVEGDLIPQPEMAMPKPKRRVEVATKPEIGFDFEVITDKAIKPIIGTQSLAKTMSTMDRIAKETRRAREDVVSGQRIEAFGRISARERVRIPFISGIPTSIFEQIEKEREKYIGAILPEIKPAKKEKPVAFIMPKYEPAPVPYPEAMPKPFEEIKFRPMPEPAPEPVPEPMPEPVPEPKPFETIKFRYEPEEKIFVPPPPPEITFLMPGEERKPRKRRKRYGVKGYPWKEKHYIPTLQELMRHAPGTKAPKSTVFEPKMPKLPKGIM